MAFDYEVGDIVKLEEKASVRRFRVGNPARRCGFPAEMCRLRTSDYGTAYPGREEYAWIAEKSRRKVKKGLVFPDTLC